jgi:hypothetical protein
MESSISSGEAADLQALTDGKKIKPQLQTSDFSLLSLVHRFSCCKFSVDKMS